jgi:transposase-like protein
MRKRRVFTREFTEQAVELALRTDRKQPEIARQLGITGNMFVQWKREVKQGETGPVNAFTSRGKARDEEVAQLRKENANLRETNRETNELLKRNYPLTYN